ncbi:MAG: ornithine cyclodeaminase [Coxiellaceae bacterium]|nr:ornithine cyclodeaminase [Coxiellaceae bacterium]
MIPVITLEDIKKITRKVGMKDFFLQLISALKTEFSHWEKFQKSARHASHAHDGVIELMPTTNTDLYSFKYVNGHPNNPKQNKLNVVAIGLLADARTGYPLMISEMTLLTAFRTAATSALAAKYLARKQVKNIGIIGTGAQAEFQVLAQHALFNVDSVKYFDIDPQAMEKFAYNLKNESFTLIPCENAESVLENVAIITTATAAKAQTKILFNDWIKDGLHINGIGGDCPGKTELDKNILSRAKIVVEYFPQSKIEGEIQQSDQPVHAELWEIITGKKSGRTSDSEITLFDSVGFAIEDFATLKLIYHLANKNNIGASMDLIPDLKNPKDLYSLL